jgi:hypothetical protein
MKNSCLIFLFLIYAAFAGFAQEKKPEDLKKDPAPAISFGNTVHDFGKISYNGGGTCFFKFENTGEVPLVILKVRGDCGCTIPSWPDKPVKAGGIDSIEVKYNTRITGFFSKTIRVHSNANNPLILLTVKGEVEPAP